MRLAVLILLLGVAGCAGEAHGPPVSSVPRNALGPDSAEPQPPNSLPPGTAVNAPLTSPIGTIGPTPVAPRTR